MSETTESRHQKNHEPIRVGFRSELSDSTKITEALPRTTSKIVRNVAGAVFSFAIFISILIWLANSDEHAPRMLKIMNDSVAKVSELPSIVWYTSEVWWTPFNRKRTCYSQSKEYFYECVIFRRESQPDDPDAYMFYGGYINGFPLPRNKETIWGLLYEETPNNRPVLMYEKSLNLFNFSATFSRYSDIPLTLIWMNGLDSVSSPQYFVETPQKNALLSEIAPVMYMQSDCDTATERDAYVKKLMDYIQVDSYGTCLQNKKLPLAKMYKEDGAKDTYLFHLYGQELLKFMARYKFVIAIENGICNDYVTEKFWRAIEVGTVPIYYGSPLIRDWLPNNKSAILLEDFPTPELLSQYLHYLLQNDTAYEEHLEHKTLGIISNEKLLDELLLRPYQTDLADSVEKFECLVCDRLHNRNKSSVNIVTKKHYDCPLPTTALTHAMNPNSTWLKHIRDAERMIDQLYEEIRSSNQMPRKSNTTWW